MSLVHQCDECKQIYVPVVLAGGRVVIVSDSDYTLCVDCLISALKEAKRGLK